MDGDTETMPSLVARAARDHGDRLAVVDGATRLTYHELADRIEDVSRSLIASGVRVGDRIAVWAPNGHHWLQAALGAHGVGAALVPLNTRYRGAEAHALLRRSRARVLFVPDRFLGRDPLQLLRDPDGPDAARRAEPDLGLPDLELVVRIPLDAATASREAETGGAANVLSWSTFVDRASSVDRVDARSRAAAVGPNDVADILFTSGTTGEPKGAMSAHRQTVAVSAAWAAHAELSTDDNYLAINPFFHSFGYKAGIVACLLRGATILPQATFDAERVLDLIEVERITVVPGAPTLFHSLLSDPQLHNHDLSSLRVAVTGAAVVPVALVERMQQELSFSAVLTAYGLSEAVVVTMCCVGDSPEVVSKTSGRPTADFAVRIAGDPPPGGDGEILLRGPNVMLGYLDDPDATDAAIEPDGWLHTGDVGHLDDTGYLTITDRLKDMYLVGGFNVYPAEVEQVIDAIDGVLESAVVGIPDDRLGEVGRAFVVPRPGVTLDEEQIRAHCRSRLANFKLPRAVTFLDQLPRNATGKVLKSQLRTPPTAPDAA